MKENIQNIINEKSNLLSLIITGIRKVIITLMIIFFIYQRFIPKDENAMEFLKSYCSKNFTTHQFDVRQIYTNNFDGIYGYDLSERIDQNAYIENCSGYSKVNGSYFKVTKRVTLLYTGSRFIVTSILYPWNTSFSNNYDEYGNLKNSVTKEGFIVEYNYY